MRTFLARAACLLAALWLVSSPASADCSGQFSAQQMCATGASAGDPGPLTYTGILTNTRLAKTAGYTLGTADCGSLIALGGTAYYDLTISAASGYDSKCAIRLVNEDSGRAKRLVINGLSNCVLWPGQTADVYNDNNVWRSTCGDRWNLSAGLTLYIDPTGSDTANDGLAATGNGPFATLQHAFEVSKASIDQKGTYNITVSASAGTFTCGNDCIHMDNQPPGSNGGGTFSVVGQGGCGGSTIFLATTGTPFQAFYSSNLLISALRVRGSGSGVSSSRGANVIVNGDVDFADTSGAQAIAFDHGTLRFAGTNCISQSAYAFIQASDSGYISFDSATISLQNNVTYTLAFAQVQGAGAFAQFVGTTINLNAHVVTGQKYYVTDLGHLTSSTGVASTYFPGTGSTVTTNGDVDGVIALSLTVAKQVFTSNGTYTPTTNMKFAMIECIGGGGGGGGAAASATGLSSGGGGGGGSYSRVLATAATIGASQTVNIGASAAGGTAGNNAGTVGNDTSVGSICIAKGGTAGGGAAANSIGTGGAGGVAGTGDFTPTGNTGNTGLGASITTILSPAGTGGGGPMGGQGGRGAAGSASAVTGGNAANYGGGGGGGSSQASASNAAGGTGAQGAVFITEYVWQ